MCAVYSRTFSTNGFLIRRRQIAFLHVAAKMVGLSVMSQNRREMAFSSGAIPA